MQIEKNEAYVSHNRSRQIELKLRRMVIFLKINFFEVSLKSFH
eukprot:UN23734